LTMTPAPGTLSAPYGAAFSQTFSAAGGTGPYSYALTGTLPAGMSFSGDTLSGTPTAPGSYPVTVTATDAGSTGTGAPFSIAQNYTINVPAPTIVVDPATLPDPVAGGAYAQSVSATGGVAPYSFAVTAGALPAGISLSTAGALSGSATQVGSFSFTVTAADANGQAGSRPYTFSVAAPTLTMTPAPGTLSAPYGAAFSQTFSAAGGTGPYSYALTGTLPAGMSFSGDTLSGTPTAPGSYPITVIATALGLTGVGAPFSIAQNYTINVPAPTIALAPATLPNTTAGLAYSASLSASGGVAPYSFAVTAGALPNGLALASNGTLSGTSISSGIFNFTITATDAFGQTANLAYSVVVAVPTLALTPTTLPAGTSGNAYNQTITVAGGIAPYTVTLSGTLPAGLVFDATSRSFSGTPTQAGSFNVDVTATDSTGGTPATVTTSYTLTIAVPTLTLTPAAGGLPDGIGGVAYQQVFHAGNGVAPYVYAIGGGALPAGLTLDPTTGALNGVPTVAGSFNFSIRATDSTTGTAGTIVQAYALALSAPAIAISPETLPAGMLGAPFDSRLAASGGTAPYQFQLIDGTLPAGVALDADGRLHGTARTSGTFAVTVRAVDALGFSGTRTLNLVISMRPDPSQDADIRGLLEAQIATARRLSDAQANNFRNRMESLHGGAEATGIANRLSLAARPSCLPDLQDASGLRCHGPSDIGASPTPDYSAATDAPAAKANPRPFGAWIGGSIRTGSMDARGRGDGADFETDGISAGVDHRFSPTFAAGLGVGYGRDASRVGDGGARLDARATTFAGYASYHPTGRIYVDALIGYQSLDYRMRREAVNDATLSGQRNGNQWFTSLTLGAEYAPVPDWTLTPYGRYDASRATLDGYSEAGDAVYALRYEAMDVDGRTGSIGLRLDGGIAMHWGTLQPQLRLEYQHDFQSDAFALLQYADGLGPIYRAGLTGFDRNRFMLGMGLLLRVDEGWSTRIEYRGLQGGNSRDHGVNLSVEKGL
ncbi:MAG TPA: putative Ig domain-containing protein, partial [Pseudoxanthomonas sp.]